MPAPERKFEYGSEESDEDDESEKEECEVDAYRIHILQFLPCGVEELRKLFQQRYIKLKESVRCTEFKRTLYNQLMGLAEELLNREDITAEDYLIKFLLIPNI